MLIICPISFLSFTQIIEELLRLQIFGQKKFPEGNLGIAL